jgi:hypothetical protein
LNKSKYNYYDNDNSKIVIKIVFVRETESHFQDVFLGVTAGLLVKKL